MSGVWLLPSMPILPIRIYSDPNVGSHTSQEVVLCDHARLIVVAVLVTFTTTFIGVSGIIGWLEIRNIVADFQIVDIIYWVGKYHGTAPVNDSEYLSTLEWDIISKRLAHRISCVFAILGHSLALNDQVLGRIRAHHLWGGHQWLVEGREIFDVCDEINCVTVRHILSDQVDQGADFDASVIGRGDTVPMVCVIIWSSVHFIGIHDCTIIERFRDDPFFIDIIFIRTVMSVGTGGPLKLLQAE